MGCYKFNPINNEIDYLITQMVVVTDVFQVLQSLSAVLIFEAMRLKVKNI